SFCSAAVTRPECPPGPAVHPATPDRAAMADPATAARAPVLAEVVPAVKEPRAMATPDPRRAPRQAAVELPAPEREAPAAAPRVREERRRGALASQAREAQERAALAAPGMAARAREVGG